MDEEQSPVMCQSGRASRKADAPRAPPRAPRPRRRRRVGRGPRRRSSPASRYRPALAAARSSRGCRGPRHGVRRGARSSGTSGRGCRAGHPRLTARDARRRVARSRRRCRGRGRCRSPRWTTGASATPSRARSRAISSCTRSSSTDDRGCRRSRRWSSAPLPWWEAASAAPPFCPRRRPCGAPLVRRRAAIRPRRTGAAAPAGTARRLQLVEHRGGTGSST